jgi:3-deoxy-D-manno-octulosonic-acid transferase
MYFWYKFVTYLISPLANIYLIFRKFKKKEHILRYKEKLAYIKINRPQGFLVWCHMASVGEAISIIPLIESFEKNEKVKSILLTTLTLSSAAVVEKKIGYNKKVIHQFAPLDTPNVVSKFLKHWSPNLSIFVDSEIWPNLITGIKKKKIPLVLVNARITKKTFLRWRLVKKFAKEIFAKFDLCTAANKESEKHLQILGAKNVQYFGNLKFAKPNFVLNQDTNSLLIEKTKENILWCAASTHHSEELFIAKTHIILKKKFNNILTIIIPRHTNRIKKITDELSNLNLKICLYSQIEKMAPNTDVILVDSYGEVEKFYNISKCIFLGKSLIISLIKDSGQNPIEPARLGCKVFHGPYVSNFLEINHYLQTLGISSVV